MIPLIPIAIGGAVVAGLTALCSSWEDDNEEAEAELEETRARYARTIRRRKARLLRNRKMKQTMLEYAACKRQLGFAERAEKVAKRYLSSGSQRLEDYRDDMRTLIRSEIPVPAQAREFERQYLARVDDMSATYGKCRRQTAALRKHLDELSDSRFYFTCSHCRRKFAVKVGDLERFKSAKGRACCENCR